MYSKVKYLICIITLFCISTNKLVKAQGNPYVRIQSPVLLDSIIQLETSIAKDNPGIQGYRIQIYANADRKAANDIRTRFLQLAPETEAYLIYQQPSFKVRVGDYRNRFEAYAMYKILLKEFENVLIVPDRINLPKHPELTNIQE
jgi:hypothetical protein